MALTVQQIAQINAEDYYKFEAYISPENFNLVRTALKNCTVVNVERFPFEYNITDRLSRQKKGFYVFVIEDMDMSPLSFCYLLYIGKVTKSDNFKNRFYGYRNSIGKAEAVKNVLMLTNLWPDNTFVYFFEVSQDHEIDEIEKVMVYKLRPPFNEQYFTEKTVSSTDLYKLAKAQMNNE
ncbi:hypothetical protein GCM10027578_30100 [Spirosoma luteolum]